tara:strand:- start:195 stop:461 length:267 start_codon:yes stop_codon:yes gene_type:complete
MMTSASWKNFYVSEYDQEMHIENPIDFAKKRTHTNMDHAILALNRLKDSIEELRECSDPHARVAISYSVKAKMRDVQYAVELIDKRID